MASEVQICNLGLAHISDSAVVSSINPPDPTIQAEHCARFYPIARDAAQEQYAWPFVRRRISLVEVTNPVNSWAYAYAMPNNWLRAAKLLLPGATDETKKQDYIIETSSAGAFILYTNAKDAVLLYNQREIDTGRFSATFVTSMSWLLASYLAGPLLKGKTGTTAKKAAFEQYLIESRQAAALSIGQQHSSQYADFQPTWISDR